MKDSNLFSIDVDSHLKSVATHTFSSLSHYPVELVRAALKRGASQVHVLLNANKIEIKDDGSGLNSQSINILNTLLDLTSPDASKEEAVEWIQLNSEHGLLAIFSPSPEKVLIENCSVSGSVNISYHKGVLKKTEPKHHQRGTRIILFPKCHRDVHQEEEILISYCKFVQKDIFLNKTLISGNPLFTDYIASIRIDNLKYRITGELAIPKTGNTCRLKLLNMGIPYRHLKYHYQQGFVFNAAIECSGELTHHILDRLISYAHKIYLWLAKNYNNASPSIQERIEELIFTHYKITGDTSLVENFFPFKVFKSRRPLSLANILQQAALSPILAIPRDKEHLTYHIGQQRILSLTREQADLLINLHNVPITFLSPWKKKRGWLLKQLFSGIKKLVKSIFFLFIPDPANKKILSPSQMTSAEQFFLQTLNRYLSANIKSLNLYADTLTAVLIFSSGPYPSIPIRNRKSSKQDQTLFIRQKHPLVQKAIEVLKQDPQNIEILVPLLVM